MKCSSKIAFSHSISATFFASFALITLALLSSNAFAQQKSYFEKHVKSNNQGSTISLGNGTIKKDGAKIVITPQDAPTGSVPSQKVDHWDSNGFNAYITLSSSGNIYNNLDFRAIAPSNAPFLDILDSDDRSIYASTQLSAALTYAPIDQLQAALSLSYSGNWGAKNNQPGLTVERVFLKWIITNSSYFTADTIVGRQQFQLGAYNEDSLLANVQPRDFFFSDVVDGITVNLDFKKGGKFRLLPVDIYGVGGRPTTSTPAVIAPKAGASSMRFDGNYNTIRFGGVYENTKLVNGLALRAFGFFSNIGVNGTGSDRSFNGAAGNVSDHDYNWLAGGKINYALQFGSSFALGLGAEFARSGGIDRKAVKAGYYDINNAGNAYGASLIPAFKIGSTSMAIPLQFFMADGGKYAKVNGLQYSHGFTSFKGQTVGGLLLSQSLGWRPSAYVGDGVVDTPQSKKRSSGSLVLSAGVKVALLNEMLELQLTAWHLRDTNRSNFFNANKKDSPSVLANKIATAASGAAFGWTQADLEAQKRFGKALATEIDLGLTYRPLDMLSIYATGAVLLPGEYYKTEIDRQVGNFIGSSKPTTGWGATLGISASL